MRLLIFKIYHEMYNSRMMFMNQDTQGSPFCLITAYVLSHLALWYFIIVVCDDQNSHIASFIDVLANLFDQIHWITVLDVKESNNNLHQWSWIWHDTSIIDFYFAVLHFQSSKMPTVFWFSPSVFWIDDIFSLSLLFVVARISFAAFFIFHARRCWI